MRARSVQRVVACVAVVAAASSSCASDDTRSSTAAQPSATTVVSATDSPTTTDPPRAPIWADEFDGVAGAPPDPARWAFETGGTGWGNRQLEFSSDTHAVTDGEGHLVITSQPLDVTTAPPCWYGACHFMSSRLTTAGLASWKYGRFEIRAAFPEGDATWPAFWMLGADIDEVGWPAAGEIDVVEHVGRDGDVVRGTAHGPGYSASEGVSARVDVEDVHDFHVYAVEWTATSIAWFADGVEYHRIDKGDEREWVFDHQFHLVLNFAMGGLLGGEPSPLDFEHKAFTVDYVRVFTA